MVFGKRSGLTAASRAGSMSQGKLTLNHLKRFRAEAKKHGNSSGVISPMILPAYTAKNQKRTDQNQMIVRFHNRKSLGFCAHYVVFHKPLARMRIQ